jgi:hypothetical protein
MRLGEDDKVVTFAATLRDEDEEKRLEIKPIFWAEAPAELRGLFKGV